jgi:2-polyprenyl-3-methyl-5-hydroxy-6-metoxy-1,4-benzoquinol methylase
MDFNEDQIRPLDIMEGQKRAFLEDVQWLRQRSDQFVEVMCPACGGSNKSKHFEKYNFIFNLCSDCETLYISPRPPEKLLREFYQNSENYKYWAENIYPKSERVRKENIFVPRLAKLVDLCENYKVNQGTIVEVGAGYGTFGEVVEEAGKFGKYIAIEPSPELALECKRKALKVIEDSVEAAASQIKEADVVASFEVIEHLFSPREFLKSCRKVLNHEGLLILTCPNWKGFETQILGPLSDTFDAEHLNYFSPASLASLVESCGFEVLRLFTPGEIDVDIVRNRIVKGAMRLEENRFIYDILMDEKPEKRNLLQSFLKASGLSSHMWIAARKK